MRNKIAIASALALFVCAPALAKDDDWQTYANARYGYALCYPANLFLPQPEAENGDGRHLTAKDGTADIAVYGGYNAPEQNLKAVEKDHADEWEATGQVTYRAIKPDWFVISGASHGKVFYEKTLSVDNGNEFDSFRIVYPATQGKIYKPIVAQMAKCFAHTGAHTGDVK